MHTWIAAEDDNEYFYKKKPILLQTGKRAPTSLVEEQKKADGGPFVLVLVLVLVLVAP